ncbi:thioredoxin family protein [Vallitalea guaymasensis]|uniref:thioredoxin family protein n=1 Tax=Vallitalea guaymasensis TaxID=1185412 RepID=UPI0023569403|nr:thioredoxin family protein [Vallitalea guaymasensis]
MNEIKKVNEIDNFIANNEICILLISSSQCGVCISVESKLDELAEEIGNINVSKVKIDTVPEISGKFLVFTVPTILVFYKGKEVIRQSRFIQFNKLRKEFNRYISY